MTIHEHMRALRRAVLLLAALGSLPLRAAPLPEVEVLADGRIRHSTLGKPFQGRVAGGDVHFFKSNAPVLGADGVRPTMAHGNIEAEWLSSRLMQESGLPSPRVDLVKVKGEAHPHAMVQHMRNQFPKARLAEGLYELPKGAKIDMQAMRRMQTVDLLIGNGDRHWANMWFVKDGATGLWKPVPFDHNVSLGTKQVVGGASTATAFESAMLKKGKFGGKEMSAATRQIFDANPAYQATVKDPRSAIGLLQEAKYVQGTLTEARIRELVDSIPDEAIGAEDKVKRRQELVDHLNRRRRRLVPTFETILRNQPEFARTEWRLQGLPPHLRNQLPTDLATRWQFVDALRADGTFDQARLRQALKGSGLSTVSAVQIENSLRSQGGVKRSLWPPFWSKQTPVGSARKTSTLRRIRQIEFAWNQRVPGFEHLELHQGPKGPELKGLPGKELAPEYTGVRKVMDTVAKDVKLQPGERIRAVRKPNGFQGIDVHVLGTDGQVIGRTRYHTPAGTVMRTAPKLKVKRAPKPKRLKRKIRIKKKPKRKMRIRVKPKIRIRGV